MSYTADSTINICDIVLFSKVHIEKKSLHQTVTEKSTKIIEKSTK